MGLRLKNHFDMMIMKKLVIVLSFWKFIRVGLL